MDALKVLIVTPWYPTLDKPTAGVFVRNQVNALSKYADLAVIHMQPVPIRKALGHFFSKKHSIETKDGFTVISRRVLSLERICYPWAAHLYARALNKCYAAYAAHWGQPHIIHAHVTLPAGYTAVKLGEKLNIPVIITEHASFFDTFTSGSRKNYGNYAVQNADEMIAVSSTLADKVKKLRQSGCRIISNIVDTDRYDLPAQKSDESFELISISLLTANKHVDYMLQALKSLIEQGQEGLRLTVVGDGKEYNNLVALTKKLDIERNVTFAGLIKNEDIPQYLAKSHCLLIASDTETQSVVGLEALSSGIPVISTTCGGPEDFINDKTGLLINKGDINALAQAILTVKQNINEYSADEIKAFAHEYCGQESVCNKITDIYRELTTEAVLPKDKE